MKLERIACFLALAAAAAFAARPAHAQVTTSKPITVKVKTAKPKKPKVDTFKGEVLHMDGSSIMVRDASDTAVVRTFTYTPALSKKLQKLLERGGYPYGERVRVKYAEGGTVAQGISGKAPKPQ
jgi:hypothetical protein